MEMTFRQYIDNPMGKRNAVFSQREMYKALYTEKFDKVFLREAGKINYTLYVDKNKDQYIAHIKVPSETVKDFYYDAVILFYTNDPAIKTSPSLQDYNVKFFSNDPAFVFTYLKVFLDNDLFFEDLKPKSSQLALKNDPNIRNPYKIPGYSKILYFAYLFMNNKNLFNKQMYTVYGVKYDKQRLRSFVDHADKKIADRQELGEKQRKEEAKSAKKEKQNIQQDNRFTNLDGNIRGVKKVGVAPVVKPVGSVKRTKTVGTVKRINKK